MKNALLIFLIFLPHWGFGDDSCSMNFLVREGIILVEARVDQKKGLFIFDTGAPCLVLNAAQFSVRESDAQLIGPNAKIPTQEKRVKAFEWGCIEKKYFLAIAIDLSHLERALDTPILGLIGFDVMRRNEILIDFERQKLVQYPSRRSGLHENGTPNVVIPFQLSNHLPIVRAEIEEIVLNLAFDSASETNMLDFSYKERLSEETDPKFIIFRGADQRDLLVTAVNISSTHIMNETFKDMEYLFIDVRKIRAIGHPQFDGLLGHPFIEVCGKVSINYRKKKIYVWKDPNNLVKN